MDLNWKTEATRAIMIGKLKSWLCKRRKINYYFLIWVKYLFKPRKIKNKFMG